jgi:CarD family transcriptional regulator
VNVVSAIPITAAVVSAALKATAAKVDPKDEDPFRKGDMVVYPTHGVGRIDRVGYEAIAGHRLNLIHVSFEENRMTLRVPVAQARAAGLRKLETPEKVDEALAILKGRPRSSRAMWSKRAQEHFIKINSGHLKALAEVVRDLQSSADGSRSSFSQRNLFELALDRLAAELAAVGRTDKAAAVDQVNQALLAAKGAPATAPEAAK